MHPQSYDRRFFWTMLLFPLAMCLFFLIDTPFMLVTLAGLLVLGGGMGWWASLDMEKPWLLRLGATVLLAGGIWFLVWFFTGGKAILHPILDFEGMFMQIQQTLEAPTPGG